MVIRSLLVQFKNERVRVFLDFAHYHDGFQLGADASDPDGYYQVGDWHDVFYRPATVTAGKIYFSVDQHTGRAVLHCHFLEHEDKGCMAYLDITAADDGATTTGLAATALVTSASSPEEATTPPPQNSTSNSTDDLPSAAAAGSLNQLHVVTCTLLSALATLMFLSR